jgi:hypothetical protein
MSSFNGKLSSPKVPILKPISGQLVVHELDHRDEFLWPCKSTDPILDIGVYCSDLNCSGDAIQACTSVVQKILFEIVDISTTIALANGRKYITPHHVFVGIGGCADLCRFFGGTTLAYPGGRVCNAMAVIFPHHEEGSVASCYNHDACNRIDKNPTTTIFGDFIQAYAKAKPSIDGVSYRGVALISAFMYRAVMYWSGHATSVQEISDWFQAALPDM